jgi:hypothetical protein
MKKAFLSAFLVALTALLSSCGFQITGNSWSGDLAASTNVVQTASIPASLKALEVNNHFGGVHVNGTDTGAAAWSWKLEVRARTADAAARLARDASCKAELIDGRLRLAVLLPETSEPHGYTSEFEITVPKSVAVRTENHFGPTEIARVAGDVSAAGENGGVAIYDVGGTVRAQTTFASLAVRNTGAATLHDQNGSIEATGINGSLDAETSFASLKAHEVNGRAVLNNQNGSIDAAIIHGPLNARTSFATLTASDIGGAARLRDQNGHVEARAVAGGADVETSFDSLSVDGVQGDASLVNQNGSLEARAVTGRVDARTSFSSMHIEGAGPEFICHNQNGSIHLRATSPALKRVEANTSFAPLELHLPAGVNPVISARTSFADVDSDFPVMMKPRGENPFAEATPGTLLVSLQNENGKINVRRD